MVQTAPFQYVFGPVLSGRLGRSLGLDLLGSRVCSMNCAYCESGPLSRLTLTRAPYVQAADLLAELSRWEAARQASGEPLPDVVTLGGLGEPTLNSDLPEIIMGVRRLLPGVPVAVLTNSSLMPDARVRAELLAADIVLPSLDSLVPEEFAKVNRAHPGLDPVVIAEGIRAFRAMFSGRLWLEVLLVAGGNDSERNLALLTEFCQGLRPDRVDVGTLSRPGTEADARPVAPATLARWRAQLGAVSAVGTVSAAARVAERVKSGQEQGGSMRPDEIRTRILASLTRRPQTGAQLAEALLADQVTVASVLAELLGAGQILARQQDGHEYYQARTA